MRENKKNVLTKNRYKRRSEFSDNWNFFFQFTEC